MRHRFSLSVNKLISLIWQAIDDVAEWSIRTIIDFLTALIMYLIFYIIQTSLTILSSVDQYCVSAKDNNLNRNIIDWITILNILILESLRT